MKIALIGNPNSGKSTLFNILTGSHQYIGNWPGVTVEKKTGYIKHYEDLEITDLPGIYSLTPNSPEEIISKNFLLNEKPDVIINIIDSNNIVRNMFLTTELMELNIPMVIALNKTENDKNKEFNVNMLGKNFAPTIAISARNSLGIKELIDLTIKTGEENIETNKIQFSPKIEKAIKDMTSLLKEKDHTRFRSLQVLEGNFTYINDDDKEKAKEIIDNLKSEDTVREQISQGRYRIINKIIDNENFKRANIKKTTISDKIDSIVTNKYLGIPIFIAVIALVYYIAIVTVGTALTDYVNDVVVDEWARGGMRNFLEGLGTSPVLISLVVDGIIKGVGAIIGFTPQMTVLFLLLTILEQCGYMARVALLLDKLFSKFGLSGRSFISLLVGTGCSVPGILASRTIEDDGQRKMTILTTSFMPCSAKLPIISLIIGSFFPKSWWLAPLSYFIGITAVIISGLILKKTDRFKNKKIPFVMELPNFQIPSVKEVLRAVWNNIRAFISKAGSIILLSSIFIWLLSSFTLKGGFSYTTDPNSSILAFLGSLIAPIFKPLGFGNWQATSATLMGFVAKENLVTTYGILTGIAEDANELVEMGNFEALSPIAEQLSQAGALSLLIFNLLCAPCFAAVGAMNQEFRDRKMTLWAIGYQTLFAYLVSFSLYQIMTAIQTSNVTIVTILGFLPIFLAIYLISRKNKEEFASEL